MYFEWILVLLLQDWWNSTSFANYYRTWNVVVHDWLYYYVYRDFLWVSTQSLDEQEVHWYLDTTDKVIVIHIILQLYHLSLSNICLLFRDLLTM